MTNFHLTKQDRNYIRCPDCGKRLWKTKHHVCCYRIADTRSVNLAQKHKGSTSSGRDLFKPEFYTKTVHVPRESPTAIVRLFMTALRPITDFRDARRVRMFLSRYHLSNAQIHAILFHLGFRYSAIEQPSLCQNLKHMRIDGYLDSKPKDLKL